MSVLRGRVRIFPSLLHIVATVRYEGTVSRIDVALRLQEQTLRHPFKVL